MGGAADDRQTAGQDAPEDLVRVREAAQAAGVTPGAVQSWIRRGLLTASAQPPRGRRVSLAAVRALAEPLDSQTPPEAVLVGTVARAGGPAVLARQELGTAGPAPQLARTSWASGPGEGCARPGPAAGLVASQRRAGGVAPCP